MRPLGLLLVLAALCMAAEPADSVATAVASVVEVRASGATGTGFLIKGDRVVTAAHVVESSPVTVVSSAGSQPASIVVHEPSVDLAVLRLQDSLDVPALELSDQLPTPAEEVFAATAQPFGGTATLSRGIVSGVVEQSIGEVVQTDAAVNPGSSGGPLLREDGVVVGVTSNKLDGAEGVAFAIPTRTVLDVLGGQGVDGENTSAASREAATATGGSPEDTSATPVRNWLVLAAPAAVLLGALFLGGVFEHRRRRRPPPPGPFDIDVQLHDARTAVQARPDNGKDV